MRHELTSLLLYIEDINGWLDENVKNDEIPSDILSKKDTYELDVKTTASGLQYRITREGTGKSPKQDSIVNVHYVGKLNNGKVFDSSIERDLPIGFPLNKVIPGWTEGASIAERRR